MRFVASVWAAVKFLWLLLTRHEVPSPSCTVCISTLCKVLLHCSLWSSLIVNLPQKSGHWLHRKRQAKWLPRISPSHDALQRTLTQTRGFCALRIIDLEISGLQTAHYGLRVGNLRICKLIVYCGIPQPKKVLNLIHEVSSGYVQASAEGMRADGLLWNAQAQCLRISKSTIIVTGHCSINTNTVYRRRRISKCQLAKSAYYINNKLCL